MGSQSQEEGLAFEGAGQTLRRKKSRGGERRPDGWEFDGGKGRGSRLVQFLVPLYFR